MRNCRNVSGLAKAVKKGIPAQLRVWGIMPNGFDPQGALLNLGEGRYRYVGKKTWKLIKSHVVVIS